MRSARHSRRGRRERGEARFELRERVFARFAAPVVSGRGCCWSNIVELCPKLVLQFEVKRERVSVE